MDDLLVVEVAKPVDELVYKILSFVGSESFSFFDKVEHVLDYYGGTPLVHSYSSM
jgi:hypothetical protein